MTTIDRGRCAACGIGFQATDHINLDLDTSRYTHGNHPATPPLPPMLRPRPLAPLDRLAWGQHRTRVALTAVQWRYTNDPLERWPRPDLDDSEVRV